MHRKNVPTLEDMAYNMLVKQGIFNIKVPINSTVAYQQKTISTIELITFKKLMPNFLQAVIDDDRNTVMEILDSNPELLLINDLPENLVIESKLTFQKFYAENPLKLAVKRKQIRMLELLLYYYDKLPQTDDMIAVKVESLSCWKYYEIKKNRDNEDEIVIPEDYLIYATSLIDIFKNETFPNGIKGELSNETELALSSLFNLLLPRKAVKLDDYLDVELLLLAIYQIYRDNYFSFNYNWNQLDTFCIRVIGLIQSLLIPETAEVFCESLENAVAEMNQGKEHKISQNAQEYQLQNGFKFYRSSRDSRYGLGFDFLCGLFGACSWETLCKNEGAIRLSVGWNSIRSFGKILSSKNNKFSELYTAMIKSIPNQLVNNCRI